MFYRELENFPQTVRAGKVHALERILGDELKENCPTQAARRKWPDTPHVGHWGNQIRREQSRA